jgi:hypothetical protein
MRSVFVRRNVLGMFLECSQNVRRMFAECSQPIKCVGIGSGIMNHSVALLERNLPPWNIMELYRLKENPLLIYPKPQIWLVSASQTLILTKVETNQKWHSGYYSILCGTIGGILPPPPCILMELYRPKRTPYLFRK